MAEVKSVFENPLYQHKPKSKMPNNRLDKEAFLKLFTAQLKYQDPLNPMKDNEFMGQLTAMTTLEQIINMNRTLEDLSSSIVNSSLLFTGANLIGKKLLLEDGKEVVAQGVAVEDGKLKINTGENYILANQIKEIKA